jgi:nicotinamide-nucleotide amidase
MSSPTSATAPTRVSLLSIGDELLLGEITDTNMPWISRTLMPLGMLVCGSETVGDELSDIVAAFQRALSRSTVVIATGGLGPTEDDITNEAVAKANGVELEFYEEVMVQMAERLKRPVSALSGSNRKQAMLPKGARVLRNDWGTAPGVHFTTKEGKHIFLMPGVPREMKGLLAERIVPWLKETFPSPHAIVVHSLHCFGVGESLIGERIKPLMQPGLNPNVGTRVGGGTVTVRLVATGKTEAEAKAALAPAVTKVREALQEGFFGEGDTTIASAALHALLKKKATLALAESCTAGLVASMLAEIPGASNALLEDGVVYSNDAKMRTCGVKEETLKAHGAVSAETAAELAEGIRKRAGATIGLSVTGIAGPGGGSEKKPVGLVFYGLATPKGVKTFERNFAGLDRNVLRERASTFALDYIRRAADEL